MHSLPSDIGISESSDPISNVIFSSIVTSKLNNISKKMISILSPAKSGLIGNRMYKGAIQQFHENSNTKHVDKLEVLQRISGMILIWILYSLKISR